MTTVFPQMDVRLLLEVLGGITVAAWIAGGIWVLTHRQKAAPERELLRQSRETWSMAPLALLERPPASAMRVVSLGGMWAYLVIAMLMLLVKSVELATGHG